MDELKVGDLIEFRFYKNSNKWYEGRIDRIQPYKNWKAIYSIEEYRLVQPIYWDNIINESEEDWREWDKNKWYYDWCFVKWFSRDYLKKRQNEKL